MAVSDYKTDPNENTTISGINIAEGCPPSGINNAIRQLMADVKTANDAVVKTVNGKTPDSNGNITPAQTGCLPLAGGTVSGETNFNGGIKFPNSGQIRTSGNTGTFSLTIFGDPDNFSYSTINIAAPTSNTPAEMSIIANDGTNKSELGLKPSGALTWVGKNIVRSVNGITANVSGNVSFTGSIRNGTVDFVPAAGDTVYGWKESQNNKTEVYWYGSNVLSNQPSQYGHLISTVSGAEIAQVFISSPSGQIFTRGGNPSGGWNGTGGSTATWYAGGLPESFNAYTATAMPNVSVPTTNNNNGVKFWTLPSGGTWRYFYVDSNTSDSHYSHATVAGGTTLQAGSNIAGIAIRIA